MSSKTEIEKDTLDQTARPGRASDRELVISRIIDAPPERVFKAWTDPELLKQWFAPLPYTTPVAELDVRPGGANLIVMRGPDGNDLPNRGVYLEVVKNEKLVITDAYTEAWEPSEKPFMTLIVTFENEGGKTKYTARVRHWTVADRETHEKMGFHQGWGQCADQLATLVTKK
ncbi:MAG TPA: SRPBCC family protein [Terrimicrobium sp.]